MRKTLLQVTLDREHGKATVNGRAYRVVRRTHVWIEAYGDEHSACTELSTSWTEIRLPNARCTVLAVFNTTCVTTMITRPDLYIYSPTHRRDLRALHRAWKATP